MSQRVFVLPRHPGHDRAGVVHDDAARGTGSAGGRPRGATATARACACTTSTARAGSLPDRHPRHEPVAHGEHEVAGAVVAAAAHVRGDGGDVAVGGDVGDREGDVDADELPVAPSADGFGARELAAPVVDDAVVVKLARNASVSWSFAACSRRATGSGGGSAIAADRTNFSRAARIYRACTTSSWSGPASPAPRRHCSSRAAA